MNKNISPVFECETFIAELPEPVIAISERGLIIYCNSATQNKFGYSVSELLGVNVSVLMPAPESAKHDDYLAAYRETKKPSVIGRGRKVFARKKDGEIFPIYLTVSEQKSDGARIFWGLIRDLTDSERQNSRFEAILGSAPLMIIFVDPDSRIQYINHLTGKLPRAKVIGSTIREHFDEENRNIVERAFEKARLQKTAVVYRMNYDGPNGLMKFEAIVNPIFIGTTFTGAVIVASNITERVEAEERQEKLLQEKSVLAQELLHRVKNNFQILDSLVALQFASVADLKTRESVGSVRARIGIMAMIHDELYTRDSSEKVNLGEHLLRISHRLLTSSGPRAGKARALNAPSGFEATQEIAANVGSLLTELITTSIKYAATSGGDLTVAFWLEATGDELRLYYIDNCPGSRSISFLQQNEPGLSVTLVRAFAQNIKGTISTEAIDCDKLPKQLQVPELKKPNNDLQAFVLHVSLS